VGLKCIDTLLNFAVSIVLARALLPEGYGIYVFALSIVTVLAVPVQLGMPTLVMRETARYKLLARWDLLKGLLRRANQAAIALSLITCMTAGGVAWWLAGEREWEQFSTFFWALPLVFLGALNRLKGAALCGLRHVIQGQIPDIILRPALFLCLALVAVRAGDMSPPQAMLLHCVAVTLAFGAGALLLLRALPKEVSSSMPSYDIRIWARSLLPLSAISGLQIVQSQTDLVMLGLLSGKQEVGLYRVAFSFASLVIFALSAVNAVLAPEIARLYTAGDKARLQSLITLAARMVFLAALPVAGTLILFGVPIINLFYGDAYQEGYTALIILSVAWLITASAGSTYDILNMTGNEMETLKGIGSSMILNVILNAILIPSYGVDGAAAATGLSIVILNVCLWRIVWRKVGLHSAAFYA